MNINTINFFPKLICLFLILQVTTISFSQEYGSLIGASFSGIFIKLDSIDYKTEDIAQYFFGDCEKLGKDAYSVDTRRDKNTLIIRLKNGIMISNSNFSRKVINDGDVDLIKRIHDYFNSPESIFCFFGYDTSVTAGFRFIRNGHTIRFRYQTAFEVVHEFGFPLDPELKILNGTYYRDPIFKDSPYLNERSRTLLKPDDENYRMVDYDSITMSLTQMVMNDLVGYDLLDEKHWIDRIYYVIK